MSTTTTSPPAVKTVEPRRGSLPILRYASAARRVRVACKEWNAIPEDGLNLLGTSYDNTGALGASTWRHVAFIEQKRPTFLGLPSARPSSDGADRAEGE